MEDFYNSPLIAAAISWLIAQTIKNLMHFIKFKKISIERFLGAGGMPSSHSAAVCAMASALARINGFNSSEYALSALLALIVMYDASGVRRAAGMHAREINRIKAIVRELDAEIPNAGEIRKAAGENSFSGGGEKSIESAKEKRIRKERRRRAFNAAKKNELKEFLGHSPLEVFFGALLGITVGIIITSL